MKQMILGIGNTLKGDDGIGIYVAERLNKCLKDKEGEPAGSKSEIIAISCGTVPENYTSIVRRHNPDRLILVDAAEMGLAPGSYRTIPPEKIGVMHISTHDLPLSLFISYVSKFCEKIILIGIQHGQMNIGTEISGAIQKNGDRLVSLIIEERLKEIKPLE